MSTGVDGTHSGAASKKSAISTFSSPPLSSNSTSSCPGEPTAAMRSVRRDWFCKKDVRKRGHYLVSRAVVCAMWMAGVDAREGAKKEGASSGQVHAAAESDSC